MPFLMIMGAVGFMFGTGGSALIAKTIGEGKQEKAKRLFSLFVYVSFIIGIVLAVLGILFIRPIASLLGAEGTLLDNCVLDGRIILVAFPVYILQMEFQSFFVTAEKPQLGLIVTVASGVTNIVLDALFVVAFEWGLVGAASATAISQAVGGIIPLIYFFGPNKSLLRLTKTQFDGRALFKACTNGSSELMSNVSMSLVSMLYNAQLMKFAGEDGVAAYGVLMYVNLIFLAAFIGYSIGTAPIIGYNYGAQNNTELRSLLKKSLVVIGSFSVAMFIFSIILAKPLSEIFVSYDKELLDLTVRGFYIFSLSFPFSGFAIFGSSFFTALNNGLVSAIISFLRTLVFQIGAVCILPQIWGIDGIWISIVVAELMATIVTIIFIFAKRSKYNY